jgi:hypothetical protein
VIDSMYAVYQIAVPAAVLYPSEIMLAGLPAGSRQILRIDYAI